MILPVGSQLRRFTLHARWATCEYVNLSAGFAGDDRGRGKHCVFFMAVKDVRNGDSRTIHSNILRSVTLVVQALFSYDHVFELDLDTEPCTVISCGQCCHRVQDSFPWHVVMGRRLYAPGPETTPSQSQSRGVRVSESES